MSTDFFRANIDDPMDKAGQLPDESIAMVGSAIRATEESSLSDPSQIDFEALKAHFDKGRKQTEAEKPKAAIDKKLTQMAHLAHGRSKYYVVCDATRRKSPPGRDRRCRQ